MNVDRLPLAESSRAQLNSELAWASPSEQMAILERWIDGAERARERSQALAGRYRNAVRVPPPAPAGPHYITTRRRP